MSRWRKVVTMTCDKCRFTGGSEEFSHHSPGLCWACCPLPMHPGGVELLTINAILGRKGEEG
jgi:hypothetical protein